MSYSPAKARQTGQASGPGTNGIITAIAGTGEFGYSGDGRPAIEAMLGEVGGIALDKAGNIYLSTDGRIRKVGYPGNLSLWTFGDIRVSDTNGIGYVMAYSGLHKSTIDLETGRTLLNFGYNENGKLISMTDRFGNITGIQRGGSGTPLSITSPDGITTRLTVDGSNHLTGVSYPDNTSYSLIYTSDGLLTDKYDLKENHFVHTYTTNGTINTVSDDEGGNWGYSRNVDTSGIATTTINTAGGNTTTYSDKTGSSGNSASVVTAPTGETTALTISVYSGASFTSTVTDSGKQGYSVSFGGKGFAIGHTDVTTNTISLYNFK